jgi:predicted secreted protein
MIMPGTVLADSYFPSQDLSSLKVTNINRSEKSVEITDAEGQRQWTRLGDTLANTRARIIKINPASIVVKTRTGHTKIPVSGGESAGNYRIGFH